MILFLFVFGVCCGFASGLQRDSACYGHNYKLPSKRFATNSSDLVYFTPNRGGPRKLLIDKGMPVDPRINISSGSFWLMSLTYRDDGTFGVLSDGIKLKKALMLQILDCAAEISMFYAASLERDVPADAVLLDYTLQDSLDEPVTLWNRSDPQSRDRRRGNIINNVWKISNLTQADDGFYNFRRRNNAVTSRILLRVKEDTLQYEQNENEPLIDPQGNLALAVPLKANTGSNHAILAPIVVSCVGIFVAIFCCCYCRKTCCKNDSSTPETEAATPAVNDHDLPPTTVPSYSGPVYPSASPHQPGYQPVNIYPPPPGITVSPSQPGITNMNPVPPGIMNVSPSQPGIMNVSPPQPGIMTVSPPQPGITNINPFPPGIMNVSPPQPGIMNVSPPQPGITNMNPFPPGIMNVRPPQPGIMNVSPPQPGITMNPLQTEVTPPTHQGPPAMPTFSSEFFSSDSEPRFELTGFSLPFAPPLSSDTPSFDVYNSNKLNF